MSWVGWGVCEEMGLARWGGCRQGGRVVRIASVARSARRREMLGARMVVGWRSLNCFFVSFESGCLKKWFRS